MNSQRLYYLDVLRIIATLGVICIHVSCKEILSDFATYNWYVGVIYDGAFRWTVPIFVMISGALFLNQAKEISTKQIFTKNISRLLFAYLFWLLFYSGLTILQNYIFTKTFTFHFLPHYHLWFLPMLMGVYLLIPILRKISTDKKIILYCLMIWIIYITGNFLFIRTIPQITELFRLNNIIGFSGYFLLGHFISIHSFSKKQSRIIYILGILGIIITIFGCISISIYKGINYLRFFDYLTPHVILTSTALFVFIKEKATNLSQRNIKFINYIRKDLFGIYLIHPAFLLIFNHNIFRNICNHIITIPIITIVTFIFSLYTAKLLRMTPLRRFIE